MHVGYLYGTCYSILTIIVTWRLDVYSPLWLMSVLHVSVSGWSAADCWCSSVWWINRISDHICCTHAAQPSPTLGLAALAGRKVFMQ